MLGLETPLLPHYVEQELHNQNLAYSEGSAQNLTHNRGNYALYHGPIMTIIKKIAKINGKHHMNMPMYCEIQNRSMYEKLTTITCLPP